MGQEAEPEINFVRLRAIVDEAIRNMGTSDDIEAMDGEKQEKELRYMQKYAELQSSKIASVISFESKYKIGTRSISFAILAIAASYILLDFPKLISIYSWLEHVPLLVGIVLVVLVIFIEPKRKNEFEKADEEIKSIQKIILKIEEKLPIRT